MTGGTTITLAGVTISPGTGVVDGDVDGADGGDAIPGISEVEVDGVDDTDTDTAVS